MGQLRNSILDLQKAVTEYETMVAKLREITDNQRGRFLDLYNTATEGPRTLSLYLIEKFRKMNTTVEAEKHKKLGELNDPHVVELVNGIVSWKNQLKQAIDKMNHERAQIRSGAMQTLNNAEQEARALQALAEKKFKNKVFKTKAFKDKIKQYVQALNETEANLLRQKQLLQFMTNPSPDRSQEFQVGMDTTVEAAAHMSGFFQKTVQTYLDGLEPNEAPKFRDENKRIGGQLNVFRQWMQESDVMEKEVQ